MPQNAHTILIYGILTNAMIKHAFQQSHISFSGNQCLHIKTTIVDAIKWSTYLNQFLDTVKLEIKWNKNKSPNLTHKIQIQTSENV